MSISILPRNTDGRHTNFEMKLNLAKLVGTVHRTSRRRKIGKDKAFSIILLMCVALIGIVKCVYPGSLTITHGCIPNCMCLGGDTTPVHGTVYTEL